MHNAINVPFRRWWSYLQFNHHHFYHRLNWFGLLLFYSSNQEFSLALYFSTAKMRPSDSTWMRTNVYVCVCAGIRHPVAEPSQLYGVWGYILFALRIIIIIYSQEIPEMVRLLCACGFLDISCVVHLSDRSFCAIMSFCLCVFSYSVCIYSIHSSPVACAFYFLEIRDYVDDVCHGNALTLQ